MNLSTPLIPSIHLFREALERRLPGSQGLRERIHRDPRLGGHEEEIAEMLATELGRSGEISISDGRLLRFGGPGPAVALRAELDALPIEERTGAVFASTNGSMHACGHDVHMAALVAVIHTIQDVGLPVPVVAILQPREETYPCGAPDMIGAPQWDEHTIRAVVGAHLQPQLPAGFVSAEAGAVNAAADAFTVTIEGRGGHAAYPHTLVDPVVAAAAVVSSIQHLVSRRSDPLEPTVVSIGSIQGGSAANIIPDEVVLMGTIRTFSATQREALLVDFVDVVSGIAAVHQCTAEVVIDNGEPVLSNDIGLVSHLDEYWPELGYDTSRALKSCGADDFSFYGEKAPSVMIFVGTGAGPNTGPGLHDAEFLPPVESVRDVALALLAGYLAGAQLILDRPEAELPQLEEERSA